MLFPLLLKARGKNFFSEKKEFLRLLSKIVDNIHLLNMAGALHFVVVYLLLLAL